MCGASTDLPSALTAIMTTQVEAGRHLLNDVRMFLRDHTSPLSPTDLETSLKTSAITHDGEEGYPAEMLDPSRIMNGLPRSGGGATVDGRTMTEGRMRYKLSDPNTCF